MAYLKQIVGGLNNMVRCLTRYLDALNIVVVVATVAISFTSVAIAFKAYQHTQIHNRPFVTLDVVPVQGKYLTAHKVGDNAFIGYSLKFRNEGSTPAINLMFPDKVGLGADAHGNPVRRSMARQPQPLALVAGEEHIGVMGLVVPLTGTNTDIIERVESGAITFTIELTVQYEGLVAAGTKYYTGFACELSSTRKQPIGLSLR